MRWSLFFLVSGFIVLSMYVAWKQGAFDFKREQMALLENSEIRKSGPSKKETLRQIKISELVANVNEPLKSQLVDLIKERKFDKAVLLYEEKTGKKEFPMAYAVMLGLAEEVKTEVKETEQ